MPRSVRQMEEAFDLATYIAAFKPKHYGDERAIDCPVCEKPGKLWVNIEKRVAYCYYCDDSQGSVINLIQLLEDCNFAGALEILKSGVKDFDAKPLLKTIESMMRQGIVTEEEDGPLPEIELPEGFTLYETAAKKPRYFKERGIDLQRAQRYGLGFCTKGYYFNRMIVPIRMGGQLVSWHARYMKKDPPDGTKKVLYPSKEKHGTAGSGQMLFNWDVASTMSRIVFTEGPFDAMAVGKTGTATFGTKFSTAQLRLLLQADPQEIIILWDPDALDKATELGAHLKDLGLPTLVAQMPDNRDPDELSPDELRKVIANASRPTLASMLRQRLRAV